MPDREKVLKAAKMCDDFRCGECPYPCYAGYSDSWPHELLQDVVALLEPQPPIIAEDMDSWCGQRFVVCPACHIQIDDGDRFCRFCGQAIETETVAKEEPHGIFECFHCGHRSVVWSADFSFEDFGMDGEGIVNVCEFQNCGAEISYAVRTDQEGKEE